MAIKRGAQELLDDIIMPQAESAAANCKVVCQASADRVLVSVPYNSCWNTESYIAWTSAFRRSWMERPKRGLCEGRLLRPVLRRSERREPATGSTAQ